MSDDLPSGSNRVTCDHSLPRPHAGKQAQMVGLHVGAAIGVAATTIFLIGFWGDTDAKCGR